MLGLHQLIDAKPRHDLSFEDVDRIYHLPIPKLIRMAGAIQVQAFPDDDVQKCTLLSIKTGGCKEDCGYCSQSAHHDTDVKPERLMDVDTIVSAAKDAKAAGSSRFCMGAAWRNPPKKGPGFDRVLSAIRQVSDMGLEVCTTLGMLDEEQAKQLAAAGVHAYNHNIDTSPEYYEKIITTRTFEERLTTLKNVRKAGMTICCGGIIGMGESIKDRVGMLLELHRMDPHPESVPINRLMPMKGTPVYEQMKKDGALGSDASAKATFDMVRTIATARIIMPRSRVRLSAGRSVMSDEAQTLCFLAGANSIFSGDKLLTAENPEVATDQALFNRLGINATDSRKEAGVVDSVESPVEPSTTASQPAH